MPIAEVAPTVRAGIASDLLVIYMTAIDLPTVPLMSHSPMYIALLKLILWRQTADHARCACCN